MVDFFQGAYHPRGISDTTLILLAKKPNASQVKDFRPISLGNFSGKIVSKILAMRLARFLPSLVDEEQAGFVQDRSIATHIVLAQDIIRDINRKATGGNVVMKFDMANAYDRLELRFLLKTMEVLGFSAGARDLIYRNICNIRYSFWINGVRTGNFRSFRGVGQGDPLSLSHRINQGRLVPFSNGRWALHISHLLYADDVLNFTNGSNRSLTVLMELLHSYEKSSGQLVSSEKSGFYIGSKAERRAGNIASITGIPRRDFPFTYLGVPMLTGRPKIVYFLNTWWRKFERQLMVGKRGFCLLQAGSLLSSPSYLDSLSTPWLVALSRKRLSIALIVSWRGSCGIFMEK